MFRNTSLQETVNMEQYKVIPSPTSFFDWDQFLKKYIKKITKLELPRDDHFKDFIEDPKSFMIQRIEWEADIRWI